MLSGIKALTTARTPRNPSAPLLSARMALKNSNPLKILISREVKDAVTVTSRAFVAWTLCLHISAARTAQMLVRRRQRGANRSRRAFGAWAALVAADTSKLRQGWSAQARAFRLLMHLLARVEGLKQECFHEWQRTLKRGAKEADAQEVGDYEFGHPSNLHTRAQQRAPEHQGIAHAADVTMGGRQMHAWSAQDSSPSSITESQTQNPAPEKNLHEHTVGEWQPSGGITRGAQTQNPAPEGVEDQDSDALARNWRCAINGCARQPLTVAREGDKGGDVDPEFSDVSSCVSSTSDERGRVGLIAGCEGDVEFLNGGVARVVAGMGAGKSDLAHR